MVWATATIQGISIARSALPVHYPSPVYNNVAMPGKLRSNQNALILEGMHQHSQSTLKVTK